DILKHERNEDYVFINLLDETPVLSPMEKVRSVYPNAMHVKRQAAMNYTISSETIEKQQVELTPLEKFEMFLKKEKGTELIKKEKKKQKEIKTIKKIEMFFKEVKGSELTNKQKEIIYEVMEDILLDEREVRKEVK